MADIRTIDFEKINRYLVLFGLRENFSQDDLSASFRLLAKLNHPDINSSSNSAEVMAEINQGYRFLKETFSDGTIEDYRRERKKEQEKERVQDIFYDQYKKGFIILQNAFSKYYGEADDKSAAGDTGRLKTELLRAKIEFAVLINDLPYNQWVNDAIDKIGSINKWLS